MLVLSKALHSQGGDPMKPVDAVREVRHERLLKKLDEHRQVAAKLSGARGSIAKKRLLATEEEVRQSEEGLKQSIDDIEPSVLAQETQMAAEMLADVQTSLEVVSGLTHDYKRLANMYRWTLPRLGIEQEPYF